MSLMKLWIKSLITYKVRHAKIFIVLTSAGTNKAEGLPTRGYAIAYEKNLNYINLDHKHSRCNPWSCDL